MSSCGAFTTGSVPCSEDLEEIIVVLEEEGVPKEDLQKNMTFVNAYVEHRVEEEIKSKFGSSSGHRSPWSGSMRSLTFEDGEQGLSANACGLIRSIDAVSSDPMNDYLGKRTMLTPRSNPSFTFGENTKN